MSLVLCPVILYCRKLQHDKMYYAFQATQSFPYAQPNGLWVQPYCSTVLGHDPLRLGLDTPCSRHVPPDAAPGEPCHQNNSHTCPCRSACNQRGLGKLHSLCCDAFALLLCTRLQAHRSEACRRPCSMSEPVDFQHAPCAHATSLCSSSADARMAWSGPARNIAGMETRSSCRLSAHLVRSAPSQRAHLCMIAAGP